MPALLSKLIHQIPAFIWVLLAVMVGLVLYTALRMYRQSRNLRAAFNDMAELVGEGEDHPDLHRGISLARLEAIRSQAQELQGQVRAWWHRIEHHLEAYQGTGKEREYFLARPARDVLPEGELFEAMYDGAKFHALPGIITSLGLAGTFAAILMGLFYVTYNPADPTQPVKGIDSLINNLSGKFASSLVALLMSILFIFLEKRAEKKNRIAYDRLITRIEDALPLLTPVRVLVDLQASALKQEVALRSISSDMVSEFKTAFTTEINPALSQQFSAQLMNELQPTLVRMTETLGNLQEAILRLETNKHDTLLKDLTVLIKAMHESIVDSLKGMGSDFHSALSGAAKLELDGMQQSMATAHSVLEQLSSRFEGIQENLGGMVDHQVEGLNRTVGEMVNRVEHMGAQMVESMGAAQLAAQEQTRDALARFANVGASAQQEMEATLSRTNAEVSQLMAAIGDGTKGFGLAAEKLNRLQEQLQTSVEVNIESLESMKGFGATMADLTDQFQTVVVQTRGVVSTQGTGIQAIQKQMDQLGTLQQGGGALLKDYATAFNVTHGRLNDMDQDLAKAFGTIHEGMQTWTLSVDGCLKSLTTKTNDHLAGITRSFSKQLEDLGDKLEDFNEALDKVVQGVGK